MANHTITPGKNWLQRAVNDGLHDQAIADRWCEETGLKPSRTAILMARQRFGIPPARNRGRQRTSRPIDWRWLVPR